MLFIARNRWGVRIFRRDRSGRGFTGMACKIFDRSKLVPCKNSRTECMKISWNRTKQERYHLLTSRTRIKDQATITRLKSSSNLINFSCFGLPVHMEFTHLVLSLVAIVPTRLKYNPDYQRSMSSKIHHLQLKFSFPSFLFFFLNVDERLENPTENKSFQIWWISEIRRLMVSIVLGFGRLC